MVENDELGSGERAASAPTDDDLSRSILDQLSEGIQVIDADFRYRYVNPAVVRHGRTTRRALLGRTMMECYPGIEETEMFRVLRQCMTSRTPASMENEFTYPDGGKGWFQLRFEPSLEGVTVLSLDITHHKLQQIAQQRTMRLLDALGRSHEVLVDAVDAGAFVRDFCRLIVATNFAYACYERASGGQLVEARAGVTVAVLYFDNNSGSSKYDPLSKGLADMIISDLSGVQDLTLVERGRLQDIIAEQKLQQSKMFDAKTTVRVGKLLGARYAVTGAIAAVEPTMRMDIRLIDVETAKIVVTDTVQGKADKFFDLEKKLIDRFTKGLNREMPRALQRADSVKTVLDYGSGLDDADKGDFKSASQKLGKLVSAAPQFQLAKTRYQEFLKKLYEAKNKRTEGLGDNAQALLDAADAELGNPSRKK